MPPALEARDNAFFLKGKRVVLLSGAVHYFRVVPDYWEDRLRKVKAAGLNCVETYVAWNAHERIRGQFDFSGILDIRRFIKTAQDVGLYVILRPGPYICSEWDFGGLPSWLLHDPNMKIRTAYPPYLDAVDAYLAKLLPLVADLQMSQGGPIIAVQVENEYGSYDNDMEYKLFLKNKFIEYGIQELLFTSDNGTGIQEGSIPGVLITSNFQELEHGHLMFEYLRHVKQPSMPMMVMEYWSGWFDHWGEQHNIVDIKKFIQVLRWILQQGSSVNFYMFHGGTNFGFMAGANEDFGATNEGGGEPYAADTTTYDYDCPVSESGQLTDKFYEIRNILHEMAPYLPSGSVPDAFPEPPEPIPSTDYGELRMEKFLTFEDILHCTKAVKSETVVPMEMLDINNHGGQNHGLILYRKKIDSGKELLFKDSVRDRATVMVNGSEIESFDSRVSNHLVHLNLSQKDNQLDILVDNMGRVNYSDYKSNLMNEQRKGLLAPVFLDNEELRDWEIFPLEWTSDCLDKFHKCDKWKSCNGDILTKQPVLYQASLEIQDQPKDTFVYLKGWVKGFVIVNGFNLGRYWNIGPQETLYLPGPVLKQGKNEILIFELHEAASDGCVHMVQEPKLGHPRLHATVLPFYGKVFIFALRNVLRLGPWVWYFLRYFVKS